MQGELKGNKKKWRNGNKQEQKTTGKQKQEKKEGVKK